jgi:hypothetical protein
MHADRKEFGGKRHNVVWYPDGTDGWAEADLPLQESIPEPQMSQ